LGEVTGVGIGHDALCLVTQCELGVAKEGIVGGGNESTRHFQDGVRGSGRDACGQCLRLGFPFGVKRFGHDDLLPE
jgi:hypothetical protein